MKKLFKSLSLAADIYDVAKKMADEDGRSIANFLTQLIYKEFGRRNA